MFRNKYSYMKTDCSKVCRSTKGLTKNYKTLVKDKFMQIASVAQWVARQSHNYPNNELAEGREFDPHPGHIFYYKDKVNSKI